METTLLHGNCLDIMPQIPDGSVDMVLCDLPYGTTKYQWDKAIDLEALWKQYRKIVKKNGAILLFSVQPFSTRLINSNPKMYRYEWIWEKTQSCGHLNAKKMPLKSHESIQVFYRLCPRIIHR